MSKGRLRQQMKLKNLYINKLHGVYDYSVDFNSDITFLYGTNGCGKTTILNITEAIITGMLFKLFEYKFETISLTCYATKNEKIIRDIVITMKNRKSIQVEYGTISVKIDFIRLESDSRRNININDIRKLYFEHYPVLNEIRKSFNYVYLPLNRDMSFKNTAEYFNANFTYYPYARSYIYQYRDEEEEYSYFDRDSNITQIELLIYNSYNRANAEIREIESGFRTQVLQALLDIDANTSEENLIGTFMESQALSISPKKINEVKKQYISILRDLTSTDVDIHNCEEFFELLKNDVKNKEGITLTSWFRFKEFSRVKKTISLAEKTRKDKEGVMSKFKLFIDTMNSFISQTDEKKEFLISADGKIGFKTAFSSKIIGPQHLSSGEKQLLIFFANLIFSVDNKKTGIFVVDEPELSLHLSWQKIFVETTMKINPNMQLIFATHSPEFVGRYRNKMFKLEKVF